MLENITRREKLKGTDPPATYANRHTLTISPEIACSLVCIYMYIWSDSHTYLSFPDLLLARDKRRIEREKRRVLSAAEFRFPSFLLVGCYRLHVIYRVCLLSTGSI